MDVLSDGYESDELETININGKFFTNQSLCDFSSQWDDFLFSPLVPCKNCNLSVVCENCTTAHITNQSTLPIQTQNRQQITPSLPLITPTIPAPERIDSLNKNPSKDNATSTIPGLDETDPMNNIPSKVTMTPTIPAPDRIDSSNNVPSKGTVITTQDTSTTISAPPPNTVTANDKPEDSATQAANIDEREQVSIDGTKDTTSADSNTSDGVTDGDGTTTA